MDWFDKYRNEGSEFKAEFSRLDIAVAFIAGGVLSGAILVIFKI